MSSPPTNSIGSAPNGRILELFHLEWEQAAAHTSRLFGWLLTLQWLVLVGMAGWITWHDPDSSDHRIALAVLLGGVGSLYPIWLAFYRPSSVRTRLLIAAVQMAYGGIFAQATGGRIEAQFHVFASLAFLSAYRDWRAIAVAVGVLALDLSLRQPWDSARTTDAPMRWIELATWVVIEVVFLLFAIRQGVLEMWTNALRHANLECTNDLIEHTVQDRTVALRASEQQLKAVYNAVADGIITINEKLTIESLNPSAEQLFGYGRGELVGVPIHQVIGGAEVLITDATLSPALSGVIPRPESLQEPYGIRRDGSRFPIELTISKTRIGTQIVLVGVLRDITDRRASENALRASEARYRLLFESNPHAMWVVDANNGRILAVNDSAIAHYGYSREQFLSMKLSDLNPPEENAWCDPLCDVTMVGLLDQQRRHRLASGECRQMELAARPIEFDGRSAALMMAIDVTSRNLLEEQLKQAQKLESIGQLAAGVAHEINTPIQYIGDNATFLSESFQELNQVLVAYREARGDPDALKAAEELAQRSDLDFLLKEIPNALNQSLDGVRHVARIVKAMKEFAHPGTVEKTPVDLNRTIETVIAVARNEWKYVAEVVTQFDPNLPNVQGLPGELNQVFLNLLVNAAHAIRATESTTKGTITITTRRLGGMAEVRVADTGCGIPESIRGRIFDPFFTTKPIGQGTGQGLAIAHAVVEKKHGGAISFQSESGRGTTFIVRLPINADRLSNSERIQVIETVRVVPGESPASTDWQAILDTTRNPAQL